MRKNTLTIILAIILVAVLGTTIFMLTKMDNLFKPKSDAEIPLFELNENDDQGIILYGDDEQEVEVKDNSSEINEAEIKKEETNKKNNQNSMNTNNTSNNNSSSAVAPEETYKQEVKSNEQSPTPKVEDNKPEEEVKDDEAIEGITSNGDGSYTLPTIEF